MINQQIGPYKITNYLGSLPGYEIFRAQSSEEPGKPFALKRILRNGTSAEEFERSILSLDADLAQLEHPNAVRYHGTVIDESSAYLITDWVNGSNLAALVQPNGIVPITHALGLFKQTADAVSAAHAQGLLHGAITAWDVTYAIKKEVKVDGFGLPALLEHLGQRDGSEYAAYRAPELAGGGEATPQSEVYALGILLIHLFVGKPPETGVGAASPVDQLLAQRQDLPERVIEVLRRATATDLEERYATVAELRDFAADQTAGQNRQLRAKAGLVQLGGLGKAKAATSDAAMAAAADLPALPDVPEMVLIPSGPYLRGSTRRPNEGPVMELDVPAFEISRYPITNRQYRRFCDATGRAYPRDPQGWTRYFEEFPDHPAIHIGFKDAVAYAAWLSAEKGGRFRIPREHEWEKAARGGLEQKKYPWGDEMPDGHAHYGFRAYAWEIDGPGVQTRRVGMFEPNGYGVYDMAGNVWEWCDDWYSPYGKEQGERRGGVFRVLRGGCWAAEADLLNCSYRMSAYHTSRDFFTGFRVARSV